LSVSEAAIGMEPGRSFHLAGVGGIGMSAVAQYLAWRGCRVWGSDRSFDQGQEQERLTFLAARGVRVVPQDGKAVLKNRPDALVCSSAVESGNPEVEAARQAGIPVMSRAALLANIFHGFPMRIAVAGTSGKTTITGMITSVLDEAGLDPTVLVGGYVRDLEAGGEPNNFRPGGTECVCIEADESDGTLELYRPTIGLVSNIALDHRPLAELKPLFGDFLWRVTRHAVLNRDCPVLSTVIPAFECDGAELIDFGISGRATVRPKAIRWLDGRVMFAVGKTIFELNMTGVYNLYNALGAISACRAAGLADETIAAGLRRFRGVARRMDLVGSADGIDIYDDFAHNPHKLRAAVESLAQRHGRLILVFQIHGFGPARLMRRELVRVLGEVLRPTDLVLLPEIYYAGGTVMRDISARDIVSDIRRAGRWAMFVSDRAELPEIISDNVQPGDGVAVMGARDPSLPELAREIAETIAATRPAAELPERMAVNE
jgi:UDP-N-acetylmuramate--alanine ligase